MWLTKKLLVSRNCQATLSQKFSQSSHFPIFSSFFLIVHSTLFTHDSIFCYSLSSQMPVNVNALAFTPWLDLTSAPGKLPFWPERDVIGHDLVSYPTWRRLSANSGIDNGWYGFGVIYKYHRLSIWHVPICYNADSEVNKQLNSAENNLSELTLTLF